MSSQVLTFTFLAICLLNPGSGFIVLNWNATCPDVKPMANFDLNRYLGVWYASESFAAPYQLFSHCIQATYSLNSPTEVKVQNEGIRGWLLGRWWLWKEVSKAEGVAKINDPTQPGALNVEFSASAEFFSAKEPNYIVAETDFENYSLVWSCVKLDWLPVRVDTAWILTRDRTKMPVNTDELKRRVASWGVDPGHFRKIFQNVC